MQKWRKTAALVAGLLCMATLAGCSGEREKGYNEIDDLTSQGIIQNQTSTLGVSSVDEDGNPVDFESQLISGTYYVVDDGVYYPLYSYLSNYDEAAETMVETYRQMYFTTENEINIPTLFSDCQLVYYSADGLLDYLTWERYYDLGHTIGLVNLQTMESGRIYLDLSDDDIISIIPDSELYAIYDLGAETLLVDKIGGYQVTEEIVSDGIITAAKKSKAYDLDLYTGTYYKNYATTANTHVFKAYELFASIEYETLRDRFYEIEIPEYFVDGYYALNGNMVRIVNGASYTEETEFNEQLLFPKLEKVYKKDGSYAYEEPDKDGTIFIYSTYEPLNRFETNQEGKLGYVPPKDSEEPAEEEVLTEEEKEILLKEAIVKEIDLYFPKGEECTVRIKSPSGETTGNIRIEIGSSVKFVNYERIEGYYEAVFRGTGEKGTLIVSGLSNNYDITLLNCEQAGVQDTAAADSEAFAEEPSEESQIEEDSSEEENRRRRG